MYLQLTKERILNLESNGKALLISLWDTTYNAFNYYNIQDGVFSSYTEHHNNLSTAYSTPVKVFKIYSSAFDIL